MNQRRIDLYIEELTVDGFEIGDGERIRASVEQELTRLLAEKGVSERLAANAHVARIESGRIEIPAGVRPTSTGRQIARKIYGALKP